MSKNNYLDSINAPNYFYQARKMFDIEDVGACVMCSFWQTRPTLEEIKERFSQLDGMLAFFKTLDYKLTIRQFEYYVYICNEMLNEKIGIEE